MNALSNVHPPPHKLQLCIVIYDNTDDARVSLQEMQEYLISLELTLEIQKTDERHYLYTLSSNDPIQTSIILDVIKFFSQGHWGIKDRGTETCQAETT